MIPDISPLLFWLLVAVGFVLAWLLAALILRSACDLCSVEAPGFLKAMLLVLMHSIVAGSIGAGIHFGFVWLEQKTSAGAGLATLFSVVFSLLVSAVIAVAIYIPTLRVRFAKAVGIWGWQFFISNVVYGVLFLLLVGGITTVEGIRRLI